MPVMVNIAFNGTIKRQVHTAKTKAEAVIWINRNEWVLERGHNWLLTNTKGETSLNLETERTVKPMGWGFKSNKWEVQGGRAVTGASTYQPAPEYRRTK